MIFLAAGYSDPIDRLRRPDRNHLCISDLQKYHIKSMGTLLNPGVGTQQVNFLLS
jgi:hypothetical protein